MADLLYRRDVLAAAIQHMPLPIRAEHLAAANAAAGFGAARNTARKDARALVARGLLVRLGDGPHTYTRTETTVTTCACDRGDYDADPCDADGCLIAERTEVGGPGPLVAPEPERFEREDIPCDCWATLRIERRNGYVHWSDCAELRRQRRGCDWCDLRPGFRTYHCPDHRGEAR